MSNSVQFFINNFLAVPMGGVRGEEENTKYWGSGFNCVANVCVSLDSIIIC